MMQQAWRSHARMRLLGSGAAYPDALMASADLVELIGRRFGFRRQREALAIARRLDIDTRHVCRAFAAAQEPALPGQSNPELAARAVAAALAGAGLDVNDLGYLIGHTTTPVQALPPNIAAVADCLGYRGPYVELRQACTGFANALMIADGLLARAGARPVAIVGSETGSLFLDPTALDDDHGQIVNLVQMGDGAGAVVLAAPEDSGQQDSAQQDTGPQIEACWFGTSGIDRSPGIRLASGATAFDHDFRAVASSGPSLIRAGVEMLEAMGYSLDGFDMLLPHQASGRVASQVASGLGIDPARVFSNARTIGNTGSAAIWMGLAALRETGLATGAKVAVLGAEASKYMFGGCVYRHG